MITSTELLQLLTTEVTTINTVLEDFFAKQKKSPATHVIPQQNLSDELASFTLVGGKRLRPILVKLGYQVMGEPDHIDLDQVAAAIELFHSGFLIHDDIFDNSFKRRHHSTVHTKYAADTTGELSPDRAQHFGTSMAILTGNLGFSYAYQMILDTSFSNELKNDVLAKRTQTFTNTTLGQELDLRLQQLPTPEIETIMKLYELKTGFYTFEMPLYIGARLGNAPDRVLQLLNQYALGCGIVFQIQDDLLGLFGESQHTGKSSLLDLQEGKRTLPIIKALNSVGPPEKRLILNSLGNPNITDQEVEDIKQIVMTSGTLAYCREQIQDYLQNAHQALHSLQEVATNQKAVRYLKALADYSAERSH